MPCVRCQRDLAEDANYCPSCGAPQRGTTRFGGRLTRSASEAKIAGVCAGFANYFDVDVTLVRALWLIFSIVPGALIGGVVAYLVAWLVMPEAAPGVQVPVRSTRLTRSSTDRRIAGVCSGIAEYFGVDATPIRLLWLIVTIVPGAIVGGIVAYLAAWLIMPPAPVAVLQEIRN
jgi:phage shock protein C